ncbi:MAG: HAMP domain-containing protein [Candidatus Omnitrophica bacterium]|nr:HAMP domain-containing protein [Candidatus Omnitrophota bacterium]
MIHFKSVKFRLTLWYAFILAVFLSVFAFLMHSELARALYRDMDKNLRLESQNLEEAILRPLGDKLKKLQNETNDLFLQRRPNLISHAIPKLRREIEHWEKTARYLTRSTFMIRIVGLDHEVLISNLKGWQREIIFPDFERDNLFMETGTSFQTIHFHGKPIRLYYRLVMYENRPIFIIQCGNSLQEVKSALQRLSLIILILIPIAVAASCVAGWFLAKRSFRSLDLMIREARQITAAYLKGRLPRTLTGDELDRLAATLNEMMDRLESSTRAVQEFSSDVSHELKTPLAIIRGEIDLALRKTRTPEEFTQTLTVIGEEVNELIRLVDDLMLLVRSDARQLRFEKTKISIAPLVEQVVERFQERASRKKIKLSFTNSKDMWMLGDSVYFKRLFSNLIDNAIKFTPEGGKVDVSVKSAKDQALIEISDTGIGIEPEVQQKVFSRFYRADQARSHEGAGLGLNIAKAICEEHGGTLSIASFPDRGTQVTVLFPLV